LLFLNILEALNIPTIQHAEDFVSGSSPPLEITKKEKAYEKKRRILFTVDYQEPGPSTSKSPPDSQAASTSYEPLYKKAFTSQPHETSTEVHQVKIQSKFLQ
jgi:hypothetical protein